MQILHLAPRSWLPIGSDRATDLRWADRVVVGMLSPNVALTEKVTISMGRLTNTQAASTSPGRFHVFDGDARCPASRSTPNWCWPGLLFASKAPRTSSASLYTKTCAPYGITNSWNSKLMEYASGHSMPNRQTRSPLLNVCHIPLLSNPSHFMVIPEPVRPFRAGSNRSFITRGDRLLGRSGA